MHEDMRRTAGPEVSARSHGIPVTIEEHVSKDIYGWARATEREVSGLMLVKLVNGAFHVYKAFMPEQDSSGGLTVLRAHSQGSLYASLLRRHGQERYMDMAGDMKGWWHSHNSMSCFWSGTDDNQAQKMAVDSGDWGLSIVVNHAGEYRCRADFVQPVKVMLDELKIKTVSNTGMQTKHNYRADNKRWNHVMTYNRPEPQRAVSTTLPQVARWGSNSRIIIPTKEEIQATKYVAFGGKTFEAKAYEQIMECYCGDFSCSDCMEVLRGVTIVH